MNIGWILFFLFCLVCGWVVAHFWFLRLLNRTKNSLIGILDRGEDEYLHLVHHNVEAHHKKQTFMEGFKACYREVDSVLTRAW